MFGKQVGNSAQERIVLSVFAAAPNPGRREIRVKVPDRCPIGQMPKPDPGLIEYLFVELPGHRRLRDPVPEEISHGSTRSANSYPPEVGTDARQSITVGVLAYAQTIDLVVLPAQSVSDDDGIVTPTGQ
jgi:hypothetical protein